jgi:hypothetical protein
MQNIDTNRPHNFPKEPVSKSGKGLNKLKARVSRVKLSKKQVIAIIIGLLILAVSISQLERLSSEGTLFGYKVKDVSSKKNAESRGSESGSLVGSSVSKDNKDSLACNSFPADKVSKIIGSEVERISGFVADRTEPYLISSCIYRSKDGSNQKRTVAILMREQKDDESAKKTFAALSKSQSGEEVKKIGDQAYFNNNANQLTVRVGKKLYTITATAKDSSKDKNKEVAIEVVKIVL